MAISDFARALKAARKAAGLTQTELGRLAGLTGSYISMLEKGRRKPPAEVRIRRLCSALKVPAGPMLEAAALERAPHLRRRVERARREGGAVRKERDRLLTTSLYHIAHRPGPLNAMSSFLDLSPGERTLMGRLFGRLRRIPSPSEAARRSDEVLDEVPSEARRRLARSLPDLLGNEAAGDGAEASDEAAELPVATPELEARLAVFDSLAEAASLDAAPEAHLAFDPSLAPPGSFVWRVPEDLAWPRIQAGDLLILDPEAERRGGELVAFLHQGDAGVGSFRAKGGRIEIESLDGGGPPLRAAEGELEFLAVVRGLHRAL